LMVLFRVFSRHNIISVMPERWINTRKELYL
jgi:hypothetical protein